MSGCPGSLRGTALVCRRRSRKRHGTGVPAQEYSQLEVVDAVPNVTADTVHVRPVYEDCNAVRWLQGLHPSAATAVLFHVACFALAPCRHVLGRQFTEGLFVEARGGVHFFLDVVDLTTLAPSHSSRCPMVTTTLYPQRYVRRQWNDWLPLHYSG